MSRLLIVLAFIPLVAFAGGGVALLDKAPDKSADMGALQNGARLYVDYCLGCHSVSHLRYGRLRDIGLSEAQIIGNSQSPGGKQREPMHSADARLSVGSVAPDLSLITRARSSELGSGADWLYTYLRSFYRDENRPTGWNNSVVENTGMPHVLWELQGELVMDDNQGLKLVKPGRPKPEEYDTIVSDLTAFLSYAAEPAASDRKWWGYVVLVGLSVFLVLAYALKREFWKDIH